MTFDPRYIDHVLSQNFEDAKALFLAPLMAIHYAHLVMLADRGIITPDNVRTLRASLDAISVRDILATPYDDTYEDLFSYLECLLVKRCGDEVAGRLHMRQARESLQRDRSWVTEIGERQASAHARLRQRVQAL